MKDDEKKEEEKITSTEKETEIKEVEKEQANSEEEKTEQSVQKDVLTGNEQNELTTKEQEDKKEKMEEANNDANDMNPEVKKEEKVQEQNTENKVNTPKKKHTKLIVSAIIALIAIVVAVVLWFVLKTKTIDLAECLNVKYTGYSGHATATIELDEKALKNKIDDSSVVKNFIKKLEYKIENPKDLSNGDELVIKVKISSTFLKDNKLKLKDDTIKIKVDGVKEPTSVDMSKYIKLEYKGLNKHATAKTTFDEDKMKEDLGEDIAKKLKDRLILNINNNENLKNDDEVEVKISIGNYYLEDMGVNLVSDVVKIKVEGLKDGKEVDAFKDIKVNFSGMSPNINVTISNNSEDECLKTVQYKASKTSGIANGETITITAVKWDEELFTEKAVTLKETKMEYKVEGQAAYIFNKSEISNDVKTELKSIFISKATSNANEKYLGYNPSNFKKQVFDNTDYKYSGVNQYNDEVDRDLSIGTPEVVSMYLLTKKDNSNARYINVITAIVRVPCKSAKTGATYNWYVTIDAANTSLKQDGKISDNTNYTINVEDGTDEEKAYQTYINSYKDKYNVEKISL